MTEETSHHLHLRRVVSQSDDPRHDDNEQEPGASTMTMRSDGIDVHIMTDDGREGQVAVSSSAMYTPTVGTSHHHQVEGAAGGGAPTASAANANAAWIEPSSSAQALQLAEGSVLYVPNHPNHPMADRDISSSSLSDDAEDDDDDDGKGGSQGGLLRFVTALTGSRNNSNAATSSSNDHVAAQPRGQPEQLSSSEIEEEGMAQGNDNDDEDEAMSTAEESTMERTGSQNSSRDWGWFEDVHQSLNEVTAGDMGLLASSKTSATVADASTTDPDAATDTGRNDQQSNQQQQQRSNIDSKKAQQHKPPKKKRGLVPQVSSGLQDFAPAPVKNQEPSDAAAAMAVTAPNYVLEESLSSQKLWKETAGQRPPQPAEERAFYEKMWAQNFARSNVEYGMPVEVLTATSPISLSPYFDAHYATSDPDPSHHHHHHPHDGDYAAASGGGDAVAAVAQAALTSGGGGGGPTPPSSGRSGNAMAPTSGRASHPGTSTIISNNQMQVNRTVHHADGSDLIVLVKGDNVFGTTVSKSFVRGPPGSATGGVDTVNISIASYRVVEARARSNSSSRPSTPGSSGGGSSSTSSGGGGGKYAQFLVIYREGSIRDTIGVWKRYSDFEELARKVTQSHEGCKFAIANLSPLSVTEEPETEHLPNAITSWRLLKKRQRWYRCLDAGYLSLKVFLLERFLHDILFESSSPKLLRDFVGADTLS